MKFNQLSTNFVAGIDLHKTPVEITILNNQAESLYQKTIKKHKWRTKKLFLKMFMRYYCLR